MMNIIDNFYILEGEKTLRFRKEKRLSNGIKTIRLISSYPTEEEKNLQIDINL